tara:strand:+ start:2527 stop:3144 length:618 start_codon:yes stop_codon:yes gene_type:complete
MKDLEDEIVELLDYNGELNSDELCEMLGEHPRIITCPNVRAKREKIRRTIAKSDRMTRFGSTSNSYYKLTSDFEVKDRERIFDIANQLIDSAVKNEGKLILYNQEQLESDAIDLLMRRRIIVESGENLICTGKAFTFDSRKRLQTTHNIPMRINQRIIKLGEKMDYLRENGKTIPGLDMIPPETTTRSAIICVALELLDMKLESV